MTTPSKYEVKDSGAREAFETGMVRDTEAGKTDYTLIMDGPMFTRWAEHMTKGASKYGPRNWQNARTQKELERFRRSLFRHFVQYMNGDVDEDHASAIFFNINAAEYVKERLGDTAASSGGVSVPSVKPISAELS